MKMTKFLPLALAVMLCAPTLAAPSNSQTSEYSLTLNPFLDIQKISENITTTVTFDDNYANLNLAAALSSSFRVYTNDAEQKIYLYGTAGSLTATEAPALYGEADASALKLIFANTSTGSGSVKATAKDVKDVVSNPTTSANAFALDLTPSLKVSTVAVNAATAAPTGALNSTTGVVTYSMANGIYDMTYTTGLKAVDNSFNTYDTKGIYKATLTLSKTSI